RDLAPRAVTDVDEPVRRQTVERGAIVRVALALPDRRRVGLEAEPLEVLEECTLESGATADPVVVFEPQQHPAAEGARQPPDPDRIGGMAEVEAPGRRRREAGRPAGAERGDAAGRVARRGHRSGSTR